MEIKERTTISLDKTEAIASYIELKTFKPNQVFRVKFIGGDYIEGSFYPVEQINKSNSFPRKIWWFSQVDGYLQSDRNKFSKEISVDEIEELDFVK